MESELAHMQSYLADLEAKQGGDNRVATLMDEIRDLAFDVGDIISTDFPKIASYERESWPKWVSCSFSFFYDAHNFAKKVEGIKKRVQEINRRRVTYGIEENHDRAVREKWAERQSKPHEEELTVVGFDQQIQKLENILLDTDSQVRAISIVGMPGLGKTTLAKKIYNSVRTRNSYNSPSYFNASAWAYVSGAPNVKEILRNIEHDLRPGEEKWKDIDLEAKLYSFLNGKRYVIVLDDIWDCKTWDKLKASIPINSKNGSRIIITSRDKNVGIHIGGRNSLHELQPLSPNDSWDLFSKKLVHPLAYTNDTSLSPGLEAIGKKIVERCGGMPLAIVVTTSLLSCKEKEEYAWKRVLERMGQEQNKCLQILALSYEDLPAHLKPCFLYFGLYPEDHKISVDDIVRLWMAEGLIQVSGEEELEDVGEDYINHMIARNLIQVDKRGSNGRVRSCRIHDLFRSLCILEARKSNFFHVSRNTSTNSSERLRRVSPHSLIDYLALTQPIPKLYALLSFNKSDWEREPTREDLQNFLEDLIYIRVLRIDDIQPVFFSKDFGNLINLTYL
ncbi:Disease resistance protein like [Actinidia chinensis var. chinensis]|uniref:Disease resistance protein like n=1 Tax=Actinidia chinensis var. chinensis TaxID=1590841 RepID=A0A2R6R297_ACTCC|nr:Disease resistance protein like [Actinidia chinensis var. chinensis]